jgi:V8-like Glu-specific endopeptidase
MASNEQHTSVGSKPPATATAADEYWTAERRAQAKPVPPPKPGKGEQAIGPALAPPTEPGHLSPRKPASEQGNDLTAVIAPGGHPVANPKAYPYSACGKLFFTQGGNNYAGSACLIARNIILTAGHCVHPGSGGSWSTNVVFYPSYPLSPGTSFSYSYLAARTEWTANGNRAFDYGMIWVDNNPGDSLGWLGLLWNAATAGRSWNAVGYPATPNPPFNGNIMNEARGVFASSTTAGTIGLTNDNMEHGSSGGPWFTDYTGGLHINGLQSFHNHDGDFVEYGPYFTQVIKELFDWISNPANRH